MACRRCGRPLVPIGTARKGGKQTHGDWENRELHKQCWVEEQREREMSGGSGAGFGGRGAGFGGWQQRKRPAQDSPDVEEKRRRNQEQINRNHARQAEESKKREFEASAPACPVCRARSIVQISRTEKNPDRLFYCCPSDDCEKGFLMWCEVKSAAAPSSPPPRPAASTPPPRAAGQPQRATLAERLLDAAREGDVRALDACLSDAGCKQLLDTVGLARRGTKAATPLRFAAFHGFEHVVKRLLHAGALPCLCDDDLNDALALARLGEHHHAAAGPAAERSGTLSALALAVAADQWVLDGVDRRPELNGRVGSIVDLPEAGRCTVRVVENGEESHYKLSCAKVSRRLLEKDECGTLLALGTRELNGCPVVVAVACDEKGRYTVRLAEDFAGYRGGHELRIKRENVAPRSGA
jgi:hypothetical protein